MADCKHDSSNVNEDGLTATCSGCRVIIEMESAPSNISPFGRYWFRKATPETRTAAHPANRPHEFLETKSGWYERVA